MVFEEDVLYEIIYPEFESRYIAKWTGKIEVHPHNSYERFYTFDILLGHNSSNDNLAVYRFYVKVDFSMLNNNYTITRVTNI